MELNRQEKEGMRVHEEGGLDKSDWEDREE